MAGVGLAKKGKAWQAFDELPNGGKIAIIGFGILLVGFTAYEIYEWYKNKQALALQVGSVQATTSTIGALKAGGMVQSFDDSQYTSWASSIQSALNGCVSSGDIADVQSIFAQLVNMLDLQYLMQAFGVQQKNPCWITHPWDTAFGSATSETGNLSWWLDQTFGVSDFVQLNAQLASAGINFTFQ